MNEKDLQRRIDNIESLIKYDTKDAVITMIDTIERISMHTNRMNQMVENVNTVNVESIVVSFLEEMTNLSHCLPFVALSNKMRAIVRDNTRKEEMEILTSYESKEESK